MWEWKYAQVFSTDSMTDCSGIQHLRDILDRTVGVAGEGGAAERAGGDYAVRGVCAEILQGSPRNRLTLSE